MGKREFHGISMEITRYSSSKDMMRRGMASASSSGIPGDNSTRTMLLYYNKVSAHTQTSRLLGNAGFNSILWQLLIYVKGKGVYE